MDTSSFHSKQLNRNIVRRRIFTILITWIFKFCQPSLVQYSQTLTATNFKEEESSESRKQKTADLLKVVKD